ncbi:Short chain dehydrogenase [Lasiodiplodia theobromae]|uniref:Short chain dehydrogenase n=1 Tax=Lasiodiplodia theobromae TaxID=45133 RepID=UPI0015C3157E|nr:Short chain dehydrogenase [Lasiodiplodia theobromae]KAF4541588.1 Short chain dehydrogenase [Lasiodiplodia theobromae]
MVPEKKIVLITGANAGVGFASATIIAEHSSSFHVIIGARSAIKGQKAVDDLKAKGFPGTVSTVKLEVQDGASIAAAAKVIEEDFGKLDVLVNNAGLMSYDTDYANQLQEEFPVNTFAPLLVTDAFVHLLKKSKDPRIINVSSSLGSTTLLREEGLDWAFKQAVTYRMSKAALNMLTVCQTAQFGLWGAKVWSYCPGFVVTNGWGDSEESRQQMRDNGAQDPRESALGILSIINGERDADAGYFINKAERIPW